jgi:hypothetical protein
MIWKEMKREFNDFERAFFRMVKAIWKGKHYWFFPKPVMVKNHHEPSHGRKKW